jgi:putative transposase
MARIARAMVPGVPYHVTHRGNHRGDVFLRPEDRNAYLGLLAKHAKQYEMEIWAYCLMTNHVHLLVVGREKHSLARAIGFTHMRYSQAVNKRMGWTGHLWANRFYSTALDGSHLWEAVRYVERNPVRASLVARCEDYPWSSAACHAGLTSDPLLSPSRPFPGAVENWSEWLSRPGDEKMIDSIRRNTCTGRPSGSDNFIDDLESRLERLLRPQKRGRKRKTADTAADDLFELVKG